MSNVQPIKAIYYPHVEFGSAAWVKSILLYWEGVYRPLPEGAQPHDEPEIRQLFEAGLLEELPLEPFTAAPKRCSAGARGAARGRKGGCPNRFRRFSVIRGLDPAYIDRKREEVVQFFKSRGWMRAAKAVRAMHAQTLALYSTVLNYLIAQERNLAPVTDDPVFDAMSTFLEVGNVTDEREKVVPVDALAAAQIFVPMLSVDAAAELSVEKLVDVRRKLAPHRRSFRERVQTQAAAIAALPNVDDGARAPRSVGGRPPRGARRGARSNEGSRGSGPLDTHGRQRARFTRRRAGARRAGDLDRRSRRPGQPRSPSASRSGFFDHRKALHEPMNHYLLSLESAVKAPDRQGLGGALRGLLAH